MLIYPAPASLRCNSDCFPTVFPECFSTDLGVLTQDCAALVERLTADSAVLSLANIGARDHTIIVQGGAYAEHDIRTCKLTRNPVLVLN